MTEWSYNGSSSRTTSNFYVCSALIVTRNTCTTPSSIACGCFLLCVYIPSIFCSYNTQVRWQVERFEAKMCVCLLGACFPLQVLFCGRPYGWVSPAWSRASPWSTAATCCSRRSSALGVQYVWCFYRDAQRMLERQGPLGALWWKYQK